jgi:hypothetical protein
MGKEVGMRKYRYIIPVIAILITILYVFIAVQRSKSQIIGMINQAGAKGEPIVICNTWLDNSFMVTFNFEPVDLVTRSFGWSSLEPFVSDSGMITFIATMEISEHPTLRIISLPEIFMNKAVIINMPDGIEQFDYASVQGGPTYVVCEEDRYAVLHLPELTIITGKFQSSPPWQSNDMDILIHPWVSADGNIIVTHFNSPTTFLREIWSYNISTGEWHKILEDIDPGLLSVSPDGSIIGLSQSHSTLPKTQFINVSDGSVLHEVFQAKDAIIGDRWIALREMNSDGVILIDMQNNWEERRIALPDKAENDYTIWVPPPGGYDEMMELREAESNSSESQ